MRPIYLLPSIWALFLCAISAADAQNVLPKPIVEYSLPEDPKLMGTDPNSGRTEELYSESHALLIGESHYRNIIDDDLPAVENEMRNLASALHDHGFRVEAYLDLTASEIRSVVEQFTKKSGFQRNARVVMYFSGHGLTRVDAMETDAMSQTPVAARVLGYLLPVDVPDPKSDEWHLNSIRLSELVEWADAMESKHVLTIVDSCFSGAIFEGNRSPATDVKLKSPKWAVFKKPIQSRSRMFISAGTAGETVPKNSSILDTFVKSLRNELRAELVDYNEDGYVTATELYNVMLRNAQIDAETSPRQGWSRTQGMRDGELIFKVASDETQTIAQIPQFPLFSNFPSQPIEKSVSESLDASCPAHCSEANALEAKLVAPLPNGEKLGFAKFTCSSEEGTVKYLRKATVDEASKSVVAVAKIWGGRADCELRYNTVKIFIKNGQAPGVDVGIDLQDIKVGILPQFIEQTRKVLPGNTNSQNAPEKASIEVWSQGFPSVSPFMVQRQAGSIKANDASLVSVPITKALAASSSSKYPALEIGSSGIKLNENGDRFDFRERLEVDITKSRRSARVELSKIIAHMTDEDIDAMIRALPNSSYRVALGVTEALGSSSIPWSSTDVVRSQKTLSLLPKIMRNNLELSKSVNRALDNMRR